jgi:polyphosphate kinase 2 (PPK2 family)
MGFSTSEEQAAFLRDAPLFERMLVDSGVTLVKYWLDISKAEQAERLAKRRANPLKQLKVSPLDAVAQEKWEAYSAARDDMLARTHTDWAPWTCVRADGKKTARLNLIRHLLRAAGRPGCDCEALDPKVVFGFETAALSDGRLSR